MRRRILHGLVFSFVALVLATSVGGSTGLPAHAQDDGGFVEVTAIPSVTLEGDVLFLPLDESFRDCVPLTGPCPEDSSTLLLVPAADRQVAWTPEGADLPGSALDVATIPAVGEPPPSPSTARFLAPVLDGRGASLLYLGRRFSNGALVDDDAGDDPAAEPSDEPYLPHVQGPAMSTVAPSPAVPKRLISTPAVLDADELVGATPVLVARRAAPSRVVFGIEADRAWGLSQRYIALIERDAVAAVARRGDVVGLVVTADGVSRSEATSGEVGDAADLGGQGPGAGRGSAAMFALAAALLAALVTSVVLLRRGRRKPTGR